MKKVILSASLLVGITATAQVDYEKRVGVNTDKPRASLEVRAIVSGNKAQGILFPHISEDEKAEWLKDEAKGLVAGTVIWNTTKLCLDYFDGTNWQCTDGTKTNEHPTKWTPGATSFTGKAVWGDEAGEVISIAKNNCPAGQTGVLLNYPANTAQQITYTATSNVSQADADQKALALMNSAEKQQERQRLAQEYANQNGTCKNDTPDTTGITLPAGITIDNGQRIIASIFDTDYLPYSAPTSLASWNNVAPIAADGAADKTIDYQGKVTTTGLSVNIPVKTTGSGTVPAYKTYVNIPAERTEDGQARVLELSWESQAFTTATKSIKATIKALDGDLNVKKLDLVGGLGSDFKGLELGTFVMPQSATDGNLPANYKGKYELRVISGIPDKNFAKETIVNGENKGYLHQFIYLPVLAEDGNIWLNNNLGADYSNINSPHFDPAKQAETPTDVRAMGSLFQWGREANGHELMNWVTYNRWKPVFEDEPLNWKSDMSAKLTTFTDNCPEGFGHPTIEDFEKLLTTNNNYHNGYNAVTSTKLKTIAVEFRYSLNGTASGGSPGFYWLDGVPSGNNMEHRGNVVRTARVETWWKSAGGSIRCIKK